MSRVLFYSRVEQRIDADLKHKSKDGYTLLEDINENDSPREKSVIRGTVS